MKNTSLRLRPVILAVSIAVLAASAPRAGAVDVQWEGGDGNFWSIGENWDTDQPPGSTDTAKFGLGAATTNVFVNTPQTVAGIQFLEGAPAYTISGQLLTIGTGGVLNFSGQTTTIDNDIAFSGYGVLRSVTLGGTITSNGQLALVGFARLTGTLNVVAGSHLIIDQAATVDGGTITQAVGSTVAFNLPSTFSVVNAGVAQFTSALSSYTNFSVIGAGSLLSAPSFSVTHTVSSLRVTQGAQAQFGGPLVTFGYTASGGVLVDGVGSTLTAGGLSRIGVDNGTLVKISNGAVATFDQLSIEATTVITTQFDVETGASLIATGGLEVGNHEGMGNYAPPPPTFLTLRQGGSVTAPTVTIGDTLTSQGTVEVLSSSNFNGGNVVIGKNGTLRVDSATATLGTFASTGVVTLNGAATLTANSMTLNAGAVLTATGGSLTTPQTTVAAGASAIFSTGSSADLGVLTHQGSLGVTGGALSAASATLGVGSDFSLAGGSADLGVVTNQGTAFFWSTGTLGVADYSTGLFGSGSVANSLSAGRALHVANTTTIAAGHTLTLDGGELRTGALSRAGTFTWTAGTLEVTGLGLAFATNGALGRNFTLDTAKTLRVTGELVVESNGIVGFEGGTVAAGTLVNRGSVTHRAGDVTFSAGLQNTAGAQLSLFHPVTISGASVNETGARITLRDGTGRLAGTGTLTNSSLITGDGIVDKPVTNAAGGEIRGEAGKTLLFTGANGTNSGRINLLGGTVQFSQPLANGAAGQINGEGVLVFPTSPVPTSLDPTAGLDNAGRLSFSGGDTQVYGTVQMLGGSRLIASGGATATFFDVFRHNGAEVKASAGSALVFFGEVRGAGSFTGTGTVYMEGGYSPGNSPAAVTLDTDVVFGDAATLTLELGGLTAGSGYDQLVLGENGSLALDGALVLDLINGFAPAAGDTFAVFDFAPGQLTGAFDEILFADALPSGLSFDTTQLTITGRIGVVPEPGSAALLLGGLTLLGLRRRHRP